jgi:hypothetical protein
MEHKTITAVGIDVSKGKSTVAVAFPPLIPVILWS